MFLKSLNCDGANNTCAERSMHILYDITLFFLVQANGFRSLSFEHLFDIFVPRDHFNPEGYGGATRETVVLLEINWFSGDLLKVECPKKASNDEPDFTLCNPHSWANATTVRWLRVKLILLRI